MKTNPMTVIIFCLAIVWWVNSSGNTMPIVAQAAESAVEPAAVEPEPVVDYGDVPAPGSVGATPVIDGVGDLAKAQPDAFGDVPTPPEAGSAFANIPPGVASTPPASDWVNNVVPVQSNNSGTCAVAVGPETLLGVYHGVKYNRARVTLNGAEVITTVQHPPGVNDYDHDAALLKIPSGKLSFMPTRAPMYYEPVTVYGLATKTKMRGFVSSYRYVSLLPETPGVRSGDSGGAVVADDGCLVGVISGFVKGFDGLPDNPRIVSFTRADYVMPYLPRSGMSAANQSIPNPVGPVDGPAFPDTPPAVNKNQSASVPSYSYQWQWQGYGFPRRRLFR